MGDRFYCQRDNLTLSLQPDRQAKYSETPTYFKTPKTAIYPIPGKVYLFNGIEKVWNNGWVELNPVEVTFPENPKLGQVFKKDNINYVFLSKKGWVEVSQISFF